MGAEGAARQWGVGGGIPAEGRRGQNEAGWGRSSGCRDRQAGRMPAVAESCWGLRKSYLGLGPRMIPSLALRRPVPQRGHEGFSEAPARERL